VKLWGSGLLAGAAGYAVLHFMSPAHQTVRGLLSMATFALVYGLVTLALGIPEAKSLAGRLIRR
jgi:hypothetical protein